MSDGALLSGSHVGFGTPPHAHNRFEEVPQEMHDMVGAKP